MTRHKVTSYEDTWKTVYPVFSFVPKIGLEENFKELRLKPLYQDETHRRLIIKTKTVAQRFCNADYIKNVETEFLSVFGIRPSFDSLLRHELNVQSDHDRYSEYPNNKFVLDIFQDALRKSGNKLLI